MKAIVNTLIAFGLLLVIVITTAIAWITSRYGWWLPLELLSHFQVQYFLLGLLLFVGLCFTRRRSLILCGLVCSVILASPVLSWYLPPRLLLANSNADLRVLIANINTQNRSYEQVLSLVRNEQPDLALFMEVDEAWAKQFNSFKDILPYSFGRAAPYNLGILVYSRYPLNEPQVDFFGTERNASIIAKIAIANQTLSFIGTHPFPPVRPEVFHSRNRQMDLARQAANALPAPKLVMGDFNMTMWSPYYQRLIRQTGLRNARHRFGILPSWPTPGTYDYSPILNFVTQFLTIPIDHCLVSPSLQVTNIRIGDVTGSDHYPLIVDLRLAR